MKRFSPWLLAFITASCQNYSADSVVSQQFVHKYGFDLSEEEWEQRAQEGQIITLLQNGVKITRTYEHGELHGATTYTFPKSAIVEKLRIYDQGTLLSETLHDIHGVPMQEEVYEFDDRMIVTRWNEKGVPLSVEEYNGDLLVSGKYYSGEHILDSEIENGNGVRMKRERSGQIISRDRIENGVLSERTTYHPNGEIHTVSHYHDYQLHGDQTKYTASGRPLMNLHWNHGILDGIKTNYRNGIKVSETPYLQGQKHGTELHYDDLGNLIAEIIWRNDKKHGCCKAYTEDSTDADWFFNGQIVSAEKFATLQEREQMIADFQALPDIDEKAPL